MKKVFLFIAVLSLTFLNAQDITDALRYSKQDILGTARYRAMSGAFGALGGDLSALQINPAGSAVFLNTSGSITISASGIDNDASYFNNFSNENSSNANFNQVGGVFVYNNNNESSALNRFALGIAYDQTANNFDEIFITGRSNNSIASYFTTEAQGIPLDLLTLQAGESINDLYAFLGENEGFSAQQAFLGFQAFVIEPDDPNDLDNASYSPNVVGNSFDQEYRHESTGLNGKLTINGGAQIHKNFYIGVNLSSHFINYDRVTEFFEGNNNAGSGVNEIIFTNRLSTLGSGFSAQIGGIAKVSKMLRLGASFESPTWYYIEEETIQRLDTFSDTDGEVIINPNVVNVFPEYTLRTPAKVTGSIALLFGKRGLISLDYSYKDYSTMEFDSDYNNNDFIILNNQIEQAFQGSSTARLGGEWRNGNWSFRGGYSYEESPYTDELIAGETIGYSVGLGYNFGRIKFDVAYDYSEQDRQQQFYPGSGFINGGNVNTYRDNLTFTLGLNL
ncbi:transporter [Aquimarina sp. MMG016]|uniref:OmpP1/FadL family transporter n=1 Tax=Aquimarina sp. MMG016 TaxID=2822690 RepID=UPI001B3A4BE8|nr:transporter [Aquimarina sp. MMG016]MBQ4820496.1 transporter [Aquimarina sp. MMG016]